MKMQQEIEPKQCREISINNLTSLCGLPAFLELEFFRLVFPGSVQKPERLTTIFAVLGVMDVVRMNHSLQIAALPDRPAFNPLMHDHVMKNKIENAIQ